MAWSGNTKNFKRQFCYWAIWPVLCWDFVDRKHANIFKIFSYKGISPDLKKNNTNKIRLNWESKRKNPLSHSRKMYKKCDLLENSIINKMLGTNCAIKIHNIRRTKLVPVSWIINPYQVGYIKEKESNNSQLLFYIILTTSNCPYCNKTRFETMLYTFSWALCLFPREAWVISLAFPEVTDKYHTCKPSLLNSQCN